MKVYLTWFMTENRFNFDRLKSVLIYSLNKHNPNVEIIEEHTEYPKQIRSLKPTHNENVFKLQKWNEMVQVSKEPVLLIDCDLLVLGDISELWTRTEDIVITYRYYSTIRYNAGVMYVNPTDASKRLFEEWASLSYDEFDPRDDFWKSVLQQAKGATQATLTYLLDRQTYCNIGHVSCAEWNSAVTDWNRFSDKTKILHIKGNLRKHILADSSMNEIQRFDPLLVNLVSLWRKYEEEMTHGI